MTEADNITPSSAQPDAENRAISRQPRGWFATFTAPALRNRIAIGFAALCLIKLILLVGLRKELFAIHWRVGEETFDWFNSVAFYAFAVLAGWNIWKLGTRCLPAGVRVVRTANICILFLCALFIVLTFHAGERNYLNAMMDEMLSWKRLQWYFISGFCFEMPFLGAWLLAYAIIYFVLWNKKKEHLILRVTGVFAAVYIMICLRDFREYRSALIIADCLGIACLVLNGGGLNPFWMALPVIGAGSFILLFQRFTLGLHLTHMNTEFTVLLSGYLLVFLGVTFIAWKRGFLSAWWRIFPFAVATFLLVNVNYPGSENYENVLAIGFTVPRYFLGEFGLMAALWLMAAGYRKLRPAGSLLWLDVLNLLLIIIALVDLRLTQIMGVRLDWNVISLAAGETTKMMWRMSQPYLPSLALVFLVIAVFYAFTLWAVSRIQRTNSDASSEELPATGRSFAFAVIACLLLGLAGLSLAPADKAEGQTIIRFAATSPLLMRAATPLMDRATFLQTTTDLGMANMFAPTPAPTRAPRELNVIVIFQESTYNKHLSLFGSQEDTQPLLSQYKDRMELFPNFYSVFAGSINARFATFTGLYPVEDYHAFTAERIPVKSIFEILHDHGYQCSMFYSSYFDYTDFRSLLRNRGIDGMHDADTMPGSDTNKSVSWGLPEEQTLGAMRQQIKTYAADKQKFFMTYVPAAPHNPFDGTPRQFQKHKAGKFGDLTPFYLNELLYMDWTITSIIDQLKESGLLDNTLVVITADHGELLGEDNGPVGHGWFLTPELANVPLIIMDPGHPGYHLNDTMGCQVDLMPTILDSLGIPLPPGELYQGTSLYSPNLNTNRTIYLNAFREYVEIQGARFTRGDRESDKQGKANSREVFEITNSGPRTIYLTDLSPATNAPVVSEFDNFQKNFLRNYSAYCRMFYPPEPGR